METNYHFILKILQFNHVRFAGDLCSFQINPQITHMTHPYYFMNMIELIWRTDLQLPCKLTNRTNINLYILHTFSSNRITNNVYKLNYKIKSHNDLWHMCTRWPRLIGHPNRTNPPAPIGCWWLSDCTISARERSMSNSFLCRPWPPENAR